MGDKITGQAFPITSYRLPKGQPSLAKPLCKAMGGAIIGMAIPQAIYARRCPGCKNSGSLGSIRCPFYLPTYLSALPLGFKWRKQVIPPFGRWRRHFLFTPAPCRSSWYPCCARQYAANSPAGPNPATSMRPRGSSVPWVILREADITWGFSSR